MQGACIHSTAVPTHSLVLFSTRCLWNACRKASQVSTSSHMKPLSRQPPIFKPSDAL